MRWLSQPDVCCHLSAVWDVDMGCMGHEARLQTVCGWFVRRMVDEVVEETSDVARHGGRGSRCPSLR